MKNAILGTVVALIMCVVVFMMLHKSKSDKKIEEKNLTNSGLEVAEENQNSQQDMKAEVSVEVETVSYEIFSPGDEAMIAGTGEMRQKNILKVVVSGKEHVVFPKDDIYRIAQYQLSPSSQFLYILKGEIAQDAMVRPYVYDVKNGVLECVREEGVDCTYQNGWPLTFGNHENIDFDGWLDDDRLQFRYDNTGLVPGAHESGPAVGLQEYISISTSTPWIVKEQ